MNDLGLVRMEFLAFWSVDDNQFDQNRRFWSIDTAGATTVLIRVPCPRFAWSSEPFRVTV